MKRLSAILLLLLTAPAFGVTGTAPQIGTPPAPALSLPSTTIADLSTANNIIYRGREAFFYCPEDALALWRCSFSSSTNYFDTIVAGTGSLTRGDNQALYTTLGTASASLISARHLPANQYTAVADIVSHNPAAGATYNDFCIGFALTTTASSDTIQYKLLADYRRTESLNQISLQYDWSGGLVFTTPIAITETPPFKLGYILNDNSVAVFIEKDGHQRLIQNQEIDLAHHDLESQATIAKLRPLLYWQSDGNQRTVVKDWSVRPLGSLGEREHVVACYDDGEPLTDSHGRVFINVDDCGPTTAQIDTVTQDSAYMRVQGAMMLYDPKTGRRVETVAKYAMRHNGKVFGCQEVSIVYERAKGLYHVFVSEWNDTRDRVKVMHLQTYRNVLRGYHVFDESEMTTVDMSALGSPFTTGDQGIYCSGVRKINGRWYLAGTVITGGDPVRVTYLASGTTPTAMDTLEFQDTELTEGGYIWRMGGHYYVATGQAVSHQRILDFSGNVVKEMDLPGGSGRVASQWDLIPVVSGNQTQYQLIGFSDVDQTIHCEDYVNAAGVYNNFATGPRIVLDGGTFSGREFTPQPEKGVEQ